MSLSYPQPKPETVGGWLELVLSWMWNSVFWGFIPLCVTFFMAAATGITSDLSNDLRVGATVLALSLCGTQLVDDLPIPIKQRTKWKWLKNASIVLVGLGTLVAALNVLYGSGISQGALAVDIRFLNTSAFWVFSFSLVVSLSAFLIRVIAADQSFAAAVEEHQKELSEHAAERDEVDGMKI